MPPGVYPRPSFEERFWSRVRKTDGCWLWTGTFGSAGYGMLSRGGGRGARSVGAHRAAYELMVGPIPAGLQIDHLCRVRACVNPAHLELVTVRENVLRGEGITARNKRATHCKRGHEFTPENTHITPRGGRKCLPCDRLFKAARDRKFYEKHKERVLAQQREYYRANRERLLAQQREYRRRAA